MRVVVFGSSLLALLLCGSVVTQAAAGETGTIRGTVDNPYVQRSAAVVFIEEAPGPIELPGANPVVDQKKLVFTPHVLAVPVGSTVDFANSDSIQHNVFSPPGSTDQFNLGSYGVGVTKQRTFHEAGEVKLLCNVHAEMNAFVIVCPTSYFDVTDKSSGAFTIENLPPGTYKLTVWHERLRSKTIEVTVAADETSQVTFSSLSRKR